MSAVRTMGVTAAVNGSKEEERRNEKTDMQVKRTDTDSDDGRFSDRMRGELGDQRGGENPGSRDSGGGGSGFRESSRDGGENGGSDHHYPVAFQGAGAQLAEMQRVVDAFNETNDKGITVTEEYVGNNNEVYSKLATAIAAGDNCQIALLGFTTVGELAAEGVLADIKPYALRDGFDLDNLLPCFNPGLFYEDQMVAMPYIRSASVLYYNKDMFQEVGCEEIPADIQEYTEILRAIRDKTGKAGVSFFAQMDFIQGAWIKSINQIGDISEDGLTPVSFEDGSMKEVMDWWLAGVKEGTIMKYTSTDASNNILSAFYSGNSHRFPAPAEIWPLSLRTVRRPE